MKVASEFEQLVDSHYASLYRFGLSLSRDPAEAADLTQQTFLLWGKKGSQLRDKAQAKSWLFTTLYREFLAFRKRDARFQHEELNEEIPVPAEELPLDQIDPGSALAALNQLDTIFRTPLTLFYLRELSYREIAEVLGIPPGTVMSRLSRGKSELRRILSESRKEARIVPLPNAAAAHRDE